VGVREKLFAEAAGKEAEAAAIQKRMLAEAEGLQQKAEAMKVLDGMGREHEEFRLGLDVRKEVALEEIEARVVIAGKQAEIMSKAFEKASINIVGGDGAFFDRFVKAVAVGQSIDGAVDHSDVLQRVLKDHLSGDANLLQDLKGVLGGLSAEAVKDLTLSALLGKLLSSTDGDNQAKVRELMEQAKKLGIDKLSPR
jgi:hypothetical protein